jgi:hypothetical protein
LDVGPQKLTASLRLDRRLALIRPTVEPGTYRPYERHVRLHFEPHLGSILLNKFVAIHMKSLYATLTEGGMSAAMQRKVGTTPTVAINAAVRLDLVPNNAATKFK